MNTSKLCKSFLQVSNQEIAMHLESVTVENLTVGAHLSQLDINYVTSMASQRHEPQKQQIVRYCDSVKFEQVLDHGDLSNGLNSCEAPTTQPHQQQPRSFASSRATSDMEDPCEDPLNVQETSAHSFSLPSTSHHIDADNTDEIMVQYTKRSKNALLESALNNPTIDETETNWLVEL